jgi:hypothetical protein
VKLNSLAQPILARLLEFDQYASSLAEHAEQAEQQVEHARDILNGRIEDPRVDVRKVQEGFDKLLKEAQAKRHRCNTEQRILSKVKLWLERQPLDTVLEVVKPRLNGQDLVQIRKRLQQIADEISQIKAAPTPSADIRDRIATYVRALARAGTPMVQGVDEGEQLNIRWPISRSASGYVPDSANPLFMAARMFPDVMIDHLHAVVEQDASKPMPVKDRAARIAVLNAETEQLRRLEEALVQQALDNGEEVTRDPSSPCWAILQVRHKRNGATA